MTENRFDKEALLWDEKPARVAVATTIAQAIREDVPLTASMDLLDYGCGTGLVGLSLYENVKSVTGVDSSVGMIEVMQKKIDNASLPNVHALVRDLMNSSLDKESYDIITAAMVFHHVENTKKLLCEFYASLREGGWIAIADLVTEDGSFHLHGNDGVAHLGFDCDMLSTMVKEVGFLNVSYRIAYTVKRGERSYPLFLLVGKKG